MTMKAVTERYQRMQRVKVGLIGLASVIVLIVIASSILGSVSSERPVTAAGSAQADVVANMTVENEAAAPGEPLVEMGVAPSTVNAQAEALPAPVPAPVAAPAPAPMAQPKN